MALYSRAFAAIEPENPHVETYLAAVFGVALSFTVVFANAAETPGFLLSLTKHRPNCCVFKPLGAYLSSNWHAGEVRAGSRLRRRG
jgi:hypothetical protein